MIGAVLDASAVLALLQNEPGAERIDGLLSIAAISSVNAAEVVNKLIRSGANPAGAAATMRAISCPILPVDADLALRAAMLAADVKGLSLGDRICLALAEREGVPALTTDRAWAQLGLAIEVELIR